MGELPAELRAVAEAELNESRNNREKKLGELERLISASDNPQQLQSVLCSIQSSTGASKERTLLAYLRSRKFDANKAFNALSSRAAFCAAHPDLTANISGREFLQLYEAGLVRVLPGTDRRGRRIIALRPSNIKSFPVDPLLIRWQVFAMTQLAARDPHFQVNGVILILNFDRLTFDDARHMAGLLSSGRMRLMFHFIRQCAPARIAGIYLLHQPRFISIVWRLVSLFLGSKIRSRVRFLGGNLSALHEHVHPSQLPPVLGGTLQQENDMEWLEEQIAAQDTALQQAAQAKACHDHMVAGLASFQLEGDEERLLDCG